MAKFALYAELKAKPGKEADVEAFLKQGAELAPFIGMASKKIRVECLGSSTPSTMKLDAMRT